MDESTQKIAAGLQSALEVFTAPGQRLYWPFVVGALIFAAALVVLRRESLKEFFSPKIWLHDSARMDMRMFFANAVLKTLLWGGYALSVLTVIGAVHHFLEGTFGATGGLAWASWQITLVYTVALFVALDGSRFLLHRLMHKSSFLWHFHQVHHSAEVLTPMTIHRVHPLESFLYGLRGALVTGIITGIFWYAFDGAAHQAELLGVNAIGLALTALGSNLRHSHLWLSYGPLERLLMSPAQHQMHHDADAEETVNYGAFLAVWDRLAQSFQRASPSRRVRRFGLGEAGNHRPDSVLSALAGPLLANARDAARAIAGQSAHPGPAILALASLSCGGDSGKTDPTPDDDFDRVQLLTDLVDEVILPAQEEALDRTNSLRTDVAALCESIGTADDTIATTSARTSWKALSVAWQKNEVFLIGPAAEDGEDFRNDIYSWPVVSPCAVDQGVMESLEKGYRIAEALPNKRGIDALEYLLFNEVLDSQCAPQIRPKGWDELSDLAKRQARCEFSLLAIDDLARLLELLSESWTDPETGFRTSLLQAGSPESDFSSAQLAVNEIFDGMFYVEKVKDQKLGIISGVREDSRCPTPDAPCAAGIESPYALSTKESVQANLDSFSALYLGAGGLGFTHFALELDGAEVDADMKLAIEGAREALADIDGSLTGALVTDFAKVQLLYEQFSVISTLMKRDLPPILQLDIPEEAGGELD